MRSIELCLINTYFFRILIPDSICNNCLTK